MGTGGHYITMLPADWSISTSHDPCLPVAMESIYSWRRSWYGPAVISYGCWTFFFRTKRGLGLVILIIQGWGMDSTGDPHYYVYANNLLLNKKKTATYLHLQITHYSPRWWLFNIPGRHSSISLLPMCSKVHKHWTFSDTTCGTVQTDWTLQRQRDSGQGQTRLLESNTVCGDIAWLVCWVVHGYKQLSPRMTEAFSVET